MTSPSTTVRSTMAGHRHRRRWPVLLWGALVAASLAPSRQAGAASFGVPPVGGGNPSGYFLLTSQDAVDALVSDALGDVAHFTVLTIESASRGMRVDLYDPGLFNPSLGANQLDVNLGSPPAPTAEIRYDLFGPDPGTGTPDTLLVTRTFGADTAGSDRRVVNLYNDNAASPGLYHLTVHMIDGVDLEQDVAVFGVSTPGHAASTLNLTAGELNEGGALVAEPLRAFPYLVKPSAGSDAFGPLCGAQFVTYDLEATPNGGEPPIVEITSADGFTFPRDGASGDARWWETEVGGVNQGPLVSTGQGIWDWSFSSLGEVEDCFSNLTPARDFNLFSVQVLGYGSGMRDFTNWKDLPDRPPFIVFNPDDPRRIYLPDDSGAAPAKEALGHAATIVAGYPVVSLGETSTLEVVLALDNPTTYDLTMLAGETTLSADASLTDPVIVGATGGLVATIDPGDARHILLSGGVAAGMRAEVTYRFDVTPMALGTFFLTGDGTDFISAAAPTTVSYQTPFTSPGSFERPNERLGPICAIEYEVIIPPCAVDAVLVPSAMRTCPGTDVTLDGTGSQVFSCPGGVPIYQWWVNGAISQAFPAPDTIVVRPYLNDTWELEVACSTDPVDCTARDSFTFDLYPAPFIDAGVDRAVCLGDRVNLGAGVSDGTPPYSNEHWSTDPPGQPGDGDTNRNIVVLPTQTTTYTFSVTDAQGCVGSASFIVTVNDPQPSISPNAPAICPGASIDLFATPGYASYAWSSSPPGEPADGATTSSINVATVGIRWTVTVTDDAGCTGDTSVTTVAGAPLSPVISPSNPQACAGQTVDITADPGYATYLWSSVEDPSVNGLTTETINVGVAGATYTVNVTDAGGCTGSTSVVLTVLPDPLPGAMNWTLRAAKLPPSDLLLTWEDLPDPAGAYQVVSADCDTDFDGTCDQDPTPAVMLASPQRTNVPVGVQSQVEIGGLDRPSWLVFYKVRALSPCSLTPGPFAIEP